MARKEVTYGVSDRGRSQGRHLSPTDSSDTERCGDPGEFRRTEKLRRIDGLGQWISTFLTLSLKVHGKGGVTTDWARSGGMREPGGARRMMIPGGAERARSQGGAPTGRRTEVEPRALRDKVESGTLHARVEMGTASPRAHQGCMLGLIVERKGCRDGSTRGGADRMACIGRACRR